jgi:hypothetical protein
MDRDLDHGFADRDERVELGAERNVITQHQQPGMVLPEPELPRGGEHAVRHLTADGPRLEAQPRDLRTDGGVQHDVTDVEVRCPADHAHDTLSTGPGDVDEAQAVGVGVRLVMQHARRRDPTHPRTRRRDALDLEAGSAHALDELVDRKLDVEVLAQPGQWDPHQKAARKRASAS